MTWTQTPGGTWTTHSRGITYRLIPCPGAIFPLEHCQETAQHLDRLQAHGQGWANGSETTIAYRPA